jgi:hypothetical protein
MINQDLVQQGINLLERGDDLLQAQEIAKLRAKFTLAIHALSQLKTGDMPLSHVPDIIRMLEA